MKGLKFLPWMPTDLFKKVKIFRLPTGSQTDLLEMVKIFRYPRGSQLIFLIQEVKIFRYSQGLTLVTGVYAVALAFGDCANTRTDTQTPRWHCIKINIMHIHIKTLKVLQSVTSLSDYSSLKEENTKSYQFFRLCLTQKSIPALFISKKKFYKVLQVFPAAEYYLFRPVRAWWRILIA